ncbi:MAG: PIN domain-containing protein [Candidatus Aminicenantes bacterium]|nr:PIN domain-containing protein [Candidatus Aminicenantes bacterium]
MSDVVFIDTSVWVDYFRNSDFPPGEWIDGLIRDDRAAVNGIVLTELITGAKGDREAGLLSDTLRGLRFLDFSTSFFAQAGAFGRKLKTKGISVPLSDLLIATHCLEHDLVLIARDRHLRDISKYLPLRYSEDALKF